MNKLRSEPPTGGRAVWLRRTRAFLCIAVGLGVLAWCFLSWWMPLPAGLSHSLPGGLDFTDRNGLMLRETPGPSGVVRPLEFEEIPRSFVDAMVAAEDRRFFSHDGIDLMAIGRAALARISGKSVGGASTITQQLIKLSSPPEPRSFLVKIREALQAMALERRWTKDRIFAAYANRTEFGRLNRGLAAASAFYFRKPATDLSTAESALLAALPHAPGRLHPLPDADAAQERQRMILNRMQNLGLLSSEETARAMVESAVLGMAGRAFHAPHFVDALLQQEITGTGTVRTTLDLPLQRTIERIVATQVARHRADGMEHAAVVVVHNPTGEILALVGSADYRAADGQFNAALAPRSAGSALKPFLYAYAFASGIEPWSVLPDVPMRYRSDEGTYEPVNFDRRHRGPVLCRAALANSLNIPAVHLLEITGGPAVFLETLRRFGIQSLNDTPASYGLGLAIGNGGVTLLELTNAYATLARAGHLQPVRWLKEAGDAPAEPALDPAACLIVLDMLADNSARAPQFGRQSPLRLPFVAATKTGTSTGFRDNWAFGTTPEFTVGVWAGNFANRPMRGVSGISGAAPIMRDTLIEVMRGHFARRFDAPPGWQFSPVHPLGGAPQEASETQSHEWVRISNPPSLPQSIVDGRVLLPDIYSDWLAGEGAWMQGFATTNGLHTDNPQAVPPRILSPANGTRLVVDPDLPESGRWLRLRCEPASAGWQSETLEIRERRGGTFARLEPGIHRIKCVSAGGNSEVELHVRSIASTGESRSKE